MAPGVWFDGERESESGDDESLTDAPFRHHRYKKRSPRINQAATEEMKNHAQKARYPLRNLRTISSPISSPLRVTMIGEKFSDIQQDKRPGAQNKTQRKLVTLKSDRLKHRRREPDTMSEDTNEAKQTSNATRPSSAPSHPPLPPSIPPNPNEQNPSMPQTLASSTPEMKIDARKQNATTLWISAPSSTDAVPLPLRSCMTMPSLFDAVFKVCGLTEPQRQNEVLGLRTTLSWTPHNGAQKYLMLSREFESSFEVFIRIVDTSACWDLEDGRLSVGIEAVMA